MTARIEAWLWASGGLDLDATATMVITEPGPVVYQARLDQPYLLTDALTAWQAAINASGLAGTYTLAWSSANQSVTISATGVASFEVEFNGNLHKALGFSAASGHTGALTYSGDIQALARYDNLRWSTMSLEPDESPVSTTRFRHGRARVMAWHTMDVARGSLYVQDARLDSFAASYCAAGRVRVYPDENVATAYSATNAGGYLDGFVLRCETVERNARGSAYSVVDLDLGVAR
jgi:hypothetical protein